MIVKLVCDNNCVRSKIGSEASCNSCLTPARGLIRQTGVSVRKEGDESESSSFRMRDLSFFLKRDIVNISWTVRIFSVEVITYDKIKNVEQ